MGGAKPCWRGARPSAAASIPALPLGFRFLPSLHFVSSCPRTVALMVGRAFTAFCIPRAGSPGLPCSRWRQVSAWCPGSRSAAGRARRLRSATSHLTFAHFKSRCVGSPLPSRACGAFEAQCLALVKKNNLGRLMACAKDLDARWLDRT